MQMAKPTIMVWKPTITGAAGAALPFSHNDLIILPPLFYRDVRNVINESELIVVGRHLVVIGHFEL